MKREWSRVRLAGTLALVFLAAACGDSGGMGGAAASCVGPYLNDQPPTGSFRGPTPTVNPGGTLTVYGHWYTSTCNDTPSHDASPLRPLEVRLILTLPGGAVKDLGSFTPAGKDMGFSTAVHIPEGTPAGTASISDDQKFPRTYKFTVGKQ